jgi:hypothetical protein
MVPKQLVCETYNLLVDSAILSRVLACGAAELLLGCVKALVCVILTLAALVEVGGSVVGIWSR